MNWSKGYTATYYAKEVDPATWRDRETIKLTDGQIKREATGLRESADLDCVNYPIEIERWIRVYMDVDQSGDSEHVALFTGIGTSPEDEINGRLISNSIECYSVLKPAEDILLMRGWYAPAGKTGGDVIADLLTATPAPVDIAENSPRLESSIVAEGNETRLSMVEKILEAMNWRMSIDGYGVIHVGPKPDEPVVTFDPIDNDSIETAVKVSCDRYACPNVFMAVDDDMTGIARDDDPDSLLSTISRGREVWQIETSCKLADNESIAQYAQRKLQEAQQVQKTVSYDRRYVPDVTPGDMIRLRYPEQGIEGIFTIDSQTVKLGYGATTSEDASTVIAAGKSDKREVVIAYLVDDSGVIFGTDSDDAAVGLTPTEKEGI